MEHSPPFLWMPMGVSSSFIWENSGTLGPVDPKVWGFMSWVTELVIQATRPEPTV